MPRSSKVLLYSVLLLLTFVILTPAAQAGRWEGREEVIDGITHVINPEQPMEKNRFLKPRELWRLGGESEADEEMFGMVRQIRTDSKGNVYILDVQLNEIRIFNADGEYLRTIGQEGEGPGDFRNAMDFFITPDDRIGVIQIMPGRISMMTTDGDGLADMPLPGGQDGAMMAMIQGAQISPELLLISMSSTTFQEDGSNVSSQRLLACDHEGEVIKPFKEQSEESSSGMIIISPDDEIDYSNHWYLSSDNRTYLAPWYHEYKIEVLDDKGDVERIITKEYKSRKRSAEQIKAIEDRYSRISFGEQSMKIDIEPDRRDISSLLVRPNGDLWILSSEGNDECQDNWYGRFDVFDSKGRFERTLSINVPYSTDYDEIILRGDRLFLMKEVNNGSRTVTSSGAGGTSTMLMMGDQNEDDDREPEPFEIVCYQLPK
ncbi:MAG: 6-bladed beta-propeller [bacterium]|nr:6-bladed beta-propeller [bacterium]